MRPKHHSLKFLFYDSTYFVAPWVLGFWAPVIPYHSLPLAIELVTNSACFNLCRRFSDLCVVAVAGHKAVHCICTSNSDCNKNMVPIRRVRFSWDQGLIVPATTNGLKLSLDADAGVLYMYRKDRPVMIFAKSRIQSFKNIHKGLLVFLHLDSVGSTSSPIFWIVFGDCSPCSSSSSSSSSSNASTLRCALVNLSFCCAWNILGTKKATSKGRAAWEDNEKLKHII